MNRQGTCGKTTETIIETQSRFLSRPRKYTNEHTYVQHTPRETQTEDNDAQGTSPERHINIILFKLPPPGTFIFSAKFALLSKVVQYKRRPCLRHFVRGPIARRTHRSASGWRKREVSGPNWFDSTVHSVASNQRSQNYKLGFVFGHFPAKTSPATRSNGPGSKNGTERT